MQPELIEFEQLIVKKKTFFGVRKTLIWFLLITVVFLVIAGCSMQRMILWPRWAMNDAGQGITESQALQADIEVIWFDENGSAARGQGTEAWFLKAHNLSPEQPAPVIIFAHGNGEVIDNWLFEFDDYRQLGLHVLLVEFKGYGRSAGKPSERAILTDFTQAYDMITQRPDVDADRVIVHGRSIGGGIAAGLAAKRPSVGLILESTFTSVTPLARKFFLPGFLVFDKLDVNSVLQNYDQPVLIIHGRRDEIIPPHHARRNFATLSPDQGTLMIFDDMSHNTPPSQEAYWAAIETFLHKTGAIAR
ncbi:Alpha/beta hydrolase family protein [Poriferisphaera corsica]|uniref:Alpha/beta hydrolase family protein n=1 Tax=Poriferisphaera corsica TaxID=2528020 RepID=A0A517YWZ3_9BACT|nr:alpha/beta hydrolase [Poriferisphaera corsica]QDU34745.1 Alpha/beta hydrolase family protein [Poriferisphaera corsica]